MNKTKKTLFNVIVEAAAVHPSFELLRTADSSKSSREMLDDIYQDFDDPDGNFLQQFQTTGFNARYFELYLFAYLSRCGYQIQRSHPNPDFIVSDGISLVAVEATTVNPSTSGKMMSQGGEAKKLSEEEMNNYFQNELAIRFGSPLYSKLQKKYWELEHCRNIPFVIAIEAFYDDESLFFSENALTRYLYGISHKAHWSQSGSLYVDTTPIKEHIIGEKRLRSNFFAQKDTEHISAVIFTNSGTNAKFARMGFHHGFGSDVIDMTRYGYCFNPDPSAMDATFFSYSLNEPPLVEPWGQGLVVLHNPNCLHPVRRDFFVDAVQCYIENNRFISEHNSWHPIASKTNIYHLGDIKKKLKEVSPRQPNLAVAAIHKDYFHTVCALSQPYADLVGEEQGWFADETESFFGVVIRDRGDDDWGFVILARDKYFVFRAIDSKFQFLTRDIARINLQIRIAELLSHPQRIFPQD